MKRIIATALLSFSAGTLAQEKEEYLDCLLEWGTRGEEEAIPFVWRVCALKHLENGMELEGPFEPFEDNTESGWDVESRSNPPETDLCDPVFGGGDCTE